MKSYEVRYLTDKGEVKTRTMPAHNKQLACKTCRMLVGGHHHTAQEVKQA